MYKKKKVLVIDGDILAYQIATNNEQPINWGDGLWTYTQSYLLVMHN